jgi:dihydroorotate dehydrogenase (fumarate)
MNLTTTYLGFKLPHPIIPGASPLADDVDSVRRLEDAGAPMIIMRSLFEEQIEREREHMLTQYECTLDHDAEARSYFPEPADWKLGPEQYLEQIHKLKSAVNIPVVASLNGVSGSGWLEYARQIEQAGADALELNVYILATDPLVTGGQIEDAVVDIAQNIRKYVRLPIAMKLSPFFSSIPNLAARLDAAGVSGLVLFNRFYQPDINIDTLDVESTLQLSTTAELLLRIRWIGILAGRIDADLCLTGGVHSSIDVIKALMCGAQAVQVVSALLKSGPDYLGRLVAGVENWMETHDYDSVSQMIGSMSLKRSPNPGEFERANYARILQQGSRVMNGEWSRI